MDGPTEGTKAIVRELVKSVYQIYQEAGDLLSDIADLSQIIGHKEAKIKLRRALRTLTNKSNHGVTRIKLLRLWTAKLKSATATQLEVDVFDD